jgi:hypothetical protein
MRLILTGNCQCGALFQKDSQLKDIVINEESQISLRCIICKRLLIISTKWEEAKPKPQTTAQKLDGKKVDDSKIEGSVSFNPLSLIYTFEDFSQAKILTRFEEFKPYQARDLSTQSKTQVRYWKAL